MTAAASALAALDGIAAWSLATLALTVLAMQRWRSARRRSSLNQALHELRRPLQALTLLSSGRPALAGGRVDGDGRWVGGQSQTPASRDRTAEPLEQAVSALRQLDRELNGGPEPGRRSEVIAARLMADACVRRWRSRAHLAGARIDLAWKGPDVLVRGDGVALAAALENLIVNAIEHGGPEITVAGRSVGRRLRIEVRDSGLGSRRPAGAGPPTEVLDRFRGRRSHGHGLTVASETASAHDGKLETDFGERGSKAVLVLPTAQRQSTGGSTVRVNW